ncbi:hypothetical protein [Maridesulfovibrio sp.]|uniref:hypothetical protein n=1 Tax=Maridesulfovibrio sp. TaxID=2795000 RepID=UPI002A187467|nr:hypothetical protein [Maridesulfovibrio sp.]
MAIGPEPMVRDDIKQGLLAAPYGFRTTPVDYVILSLELPVRNKDMKVFIEWISDKLKLPNDAA